MATIKNENEIKEYSSIEAKIADLKQRHEKVVIDVTTKEGMELAKEGRLELREVRTSIEKIRVELKEPVLKMGKLIDSEAKRITAIIEPMELNYDKAIKAEEKKKEDEKRAKEKAEQEERERKAKEEREAYEKKLAEERVRIKAEQDKKSKELEEEKKKIEAEKAELEKLKAEIEAAKKPQQIKDEIVNMAIDEDKIKAREILQNFLGKYGDDLEFELVTDAIIGYFTNLNSEAV